MKRIFLIASLCMFASFSFAQKGAVKKAKSAMSNTAEARELIKPALTDAETAQDPEAWKVAGDIEYKSFDKEYELEMTKEMTGKGGNFEVMYTGLYNMIDLYKKADELGELPDSKGKIKNKVRKDIVKNLKFAYPYYVNGGIYYNGEALKASQAEDKEKAKILNEKASEFFELHWDIPAFEMLQGEKIVEEDGIFQEIKYYAVVSAIQSNNQERSLALLNKIIASPYIQNDTHQESDPYELLCVEYERAGDSIKYIEALRAGAKKFPRNKYFTPNLINEFIKAGEAKAALDYIDQAVKNDSESSCELLSLKASLLANETKLGESEAIYKDVLSLDPDCAKALEGLGVLYVLQAQEVKNKIGQTSNRQELAAIDRETIDYYNKSLPYLEKYYEQLEVSDADEYDQRRALQNLENVYYNLSLLNVDKNAELEKVQDKLGK